MNPERLFLDSLPLIERILGAISHRYALGPDEAEDFASQAKLRLIEDDYRRLRGFAERSKFSTYLRVVLTNLFRDYRIEKWGKYRVSKAAQRLGPSAILLDRLVRRDRLSEGEAIQMLLLRPDVEEKEEQLEELLRALPQRQERREELTPDEFFLQTPSPLSADQAQEEEEQRQALAPLRQALEEALADQSEEEQLILRLRFFEGSAVVDIARLLGKDQKRLYRQVEKLLGRLKQALLDRGIDEAATRRLLSDTLGELDPAGGTLEEAPGPAARTNTAKSVQSTERSPSAPAQGGSSARPS
jgi:RNA polymerase sigma factor for flagellar operon FliA